MVTLNHLPGQPFPIRHHSSEKKVFEAIPSRLITSYTGEEADPHVTKASFQGVAWSVKVSPEPPLFKTEQFQLPQLLLVLQLCCLSLDTFQGLNVFLAVKGSKLLAGSKKDTRTEFSFKFNMNWEVLQHSKKYA